MKEDIKIYVAVFVALFISVVLFGLNTSNSNMAKPLLSNVSSSNNSETELPDISISKPEAGGRIVKISSVDINTPGFIIVRRASSKIILPIIGASQYLSIGTTNDVLIVLTESIRSGEWLDLNFYKDDGNKSFSSHIDQPVSNNEGMVGRISFGVQ